LAFNLIEYSEVSVDYVRIKFGRTIKVSSIVDSNFKVFTNSSTPVEVVSPFRDINVLTDYNSISRILVLYWDVVLDGSTDYIIRLQNILDSSGAVIPEEQIVFTSPETSATPSTISEYTGTVVQEVLIEDKSVRVDIETGYQIIAKNPNFYVEEVSPSNGDFYIENDFNDGRVSVTFNARPASNFLTSKYFKAQRKKIQKTPTRWETLDAEVSIHSWKPDVYIDFPSNDDVPVYYTEGKTYFEKGYKYRIIISSEVGI
jgi:hypothetical protein